MITQRDFDNYPALAARILADHGPAAASLVAEEQRQATIAGDPEGAAFWGLVKSRLERNTGECSTS